MTFLLNLIPQYRSLLETVRTLSEEKLRLQDRLDAAIEDKRRTWDMMQEAINNERFSYRTGLNIAHQRLGEGPLYPEAYTLPASKMPNPETPRPMREIATPSQRIARQAEANLREYFATASAAQ